MTYLSCDLLSLSQHNHCIQTLAAGLPGQIDVYARCLAKRQQLLQLSDRCIQLCLEWRSYSKSNGFRLKNHKAVKIPQGAESCLVSKQCTQQ